MPPIALNDTADIINAPLAVFSKAAKYGDFRDELQEHGFCVVKGAIPRPRAVELQNKAFDWLLSFGTALDLQDPTTWTQENLPRQNFVRAFAAYCLPHERFMWEARTEPGVLKTFETLWGTDELLVSFDGLNVTFPNREDLPARKPWEHMDQNPRKRGLHCVQGIINLSLSGPEDGGLVVFPGSHKLHDEFFETHEVRPEAMPGADVYLFNEEELAWWREKGVRPHKVCADVGDLILWDSRTIHYGSDPMSTSKVTRTAIYATYMPAKLATEEQLALKRQVFEDYAVTSHWPYEHLKAGRILARLEDGSLDPRNREQPREMPEMTDTMMKLAGLKSY